MKRCCITENLVDGRGHMAGDDVLGGGLAHSR